MNDKQKIKDKRLTNNKGDMKKIHEKISKHNHCEHGHLEYCAHCDEVVCLDCGKEWSNKMASLTYAGGGYNCL